MFPEDPDFFFGWAAAREAGSRRRSRQGLRPGRPTGPPLAAGLGAELSLPERRARGSRPQHAGAHEPDRRALRRRQGEGRQGLRLGVGHSLSDFWRSGRTRSRRRCVCDKGLRRALRGMAGPGCPDVLDGGRGLAPSLACGRAVHRGPGAEGPRSCTPAVPMGLRLRVSGPLATPAPPIRAGGARYNPASRRQVMSFPERFPQGNQPGFGHGSVPASLLGSWFPPLGGTQPRLVAIRRVSALCQPTGFLAGGNCGFGAHAHRTGWRGASRPPSPANLAQPRPTATS